MHPSRPTALTVLLYLTLLPGCATICPPPVVPVIPAALLTPAPEPAPPPVTATDAEVAGYLVRAVDWGRGLREQLLSVTVLLGVTK